MIDIVQCSKCIVIQSYAGMVIWESDDGFLPTWQVGV